MRRCPGVDRLKRLIRPLAISCLSFRFAGANRSMPHPRANASIVPMLIAGSHECIIDSLATVDRASPEASAISLLDIGLRPWLFRARKRQCAGLTLLSRRRRDKRPLPIWRAEIEHLPRGDSSGQSRLVVDGEGRAGWDLGD